MLKLIVGVIVSIMVIVFTMSMVLAAVWADDQMENWF